MRACDVIKTRDNRKIIQSIAFLKQRTQKPVINAMMAADQEIQVKHKKERRVDALALRADERRDKLR